ncbi:hypothetical protein G6F50_018104 [Rhizopus delemar]|uniref:Uncharacterized protein n=1 Tax=Rhizopus delemar TaxID=936053 RepID=A0A9P6XNE7_9FUNG|nr:hypothetical protein G6F50_018104 [Rhizopus delemar]
MSWTFILSSASEVKAVTATGTSCRVSSRLRAVTLTLSRLVGEADRPAGGASCASTGPAASHAPIMRLKPFRFIHSSPRHVRIDGR